MQTPRQFAQSLAWMTFNRKPDLNQWENHIRARDATVRAPLVEALEKIAHWTPGIVYGSAPVDFQEIARAALEAAKGQG